MEFFKVAGSRGLYHPVGLVAAGQGRQMALAAIRHACDLGLTELLINVLGLTGTAPPKVFERHEFVRQWVAISGNRLRVAIVMPAEYMDPHNIGVVMASNRGASGHSFTSEAEALAWLDDRRATGNAGG